MRKDGPRWEMESIEVKAKHHHDQPPATSRSGRSAYARRDYSKLTATSDRIKEPLSVKEALGRSDAKRWIEAINAELKSFDEKEVYELIPNPGNNNIVGSKVVFKIKRTKEGLIKRYKARLVAQGFSQQEGIDYLETSSPVARLDSLKMVLAISAMEDWEAEQMDVPTCFLNSPIDPTLQILMRQPKGYEKKGFEDWVWKLKKSIYGLKQASKDLHDLANKTLKEMGFKPCATDNCVFTKETPTGLFYIVLFYY
jgi:hypothetical protein